MDKFPHGTLKEIAAKAGISPQLLSDILKSRRKAGADLAQKLVDAAKAHGCETSVFDWLNPDYTANPLFKEYQA